MWQIISTYIIAFIMLGSVLLFAKIILNKKMNIKISHLLMIICIIIIQVIASKHANDILKTLIMTITNFIIIKKIYNESVQKSLFLALLHMLILIFPDAILYYISQKVGNGFLYNIYYGDIVRNIISFIIFIGITFVLKVPLRKIINTNISYNLKILIYSNLTLICVLTIFYNAFSNIFTNVDVIIGVFSMIIFVIILFSLIKQTIENNKLSDEYDKLLEYMTTYENEIENQRILRHEIKNEFRTIRAKISDKQKNKEIIEYIDEILNDKYEINKEKYARFGYLPPNGIKGLFYFKAQEAENKGIKVSINISKKLKNSTIYHLNVKQQRDFGRIIGVFLDNAIEASIETKEKQIGIEVYVNENEEVKLIISNTYNNKIDKTKLGIETFSTKGKTRGHGLLLVKQLVSKNDIFEIKTNIENNIYIQILEIKKIIEE